MNVETTLSFLKTYLERTPVKDLDYETVNDILFPHGSNTSWTASEAEEVIIEMGNVALNVDRDVSPTKDRTPRFDWIVDLQSELDAADRSTW